jgi:hypothetical protein
MSDISGFSRELSEGRKVFVGRYDESSWALFFVSAEGTETKIRLSDEAMGAVIDLYKIARGGTGDVGTWMVVIRTEALMDAVLASADRPEETA